MQRFARASEGNPAGFLLAPLYAIIIPDVMKFTTLADVRVLVENHLPAEYRSKFTLRQLAELLGRAAEVSRTWPESRM